MGSAQADIEEPLPEGRRGRSFGPWLGRAGLAVLALLAAYGWSSRERIVGDGIDDYLATAGIDAAYEIVSIGPRRQVIANVVVGDRRNPDLTIERVSVDLSYGFGAPVIGAVLVEKPRLYGTYRGGELSFGALDPVLFADSEEAAAGLPAIEVRVRDGGALLETDYGAVGAFFEGSGPLDDGFAGKLALSAPGIGLEGCTARRASAYGDLVTRDGAPRFSGPVRLRGFACEGVKLASADIGTTLSTLSDFTKINAAFDLSAREIAFEQTSAEGASGRATASFSDGALVLDHDIALAGIAMPYARLATLRGDGVLRSARGFRESSWNASLEGKGVALAQDSTDALRSAREAGEGTLLASLLARLETGLSRTARDGDISAELTARANGEALSLVVPEARLRAATGETVLALSRFSWSREGSSAPARLAGNVLTGGADLPQISARIEQEAGGALAARASLAPYRAGEDVIAVPSLTLRGLPGGAYAFAGALRASGAVPGGAIDSLVLSFSGQIAADGRVRAGAACQEVRFRSLAAYDLKLENSALQLCPGETGTMIAYGETLDIDVTTDAVDLAGELAGSPARIAADRASLSYPGGFALEGARVTLGPADNAVRLTSASLSGDFDEQPGGEFAGASAMIDAVPLDLSQLEGRWSYTKGVLRLLDADFLLTERPIEGAEARFNPLSSRGATLTFEDGTIAALARLDHEATGVSLGNVSIAHDLSTSQGFTLIDVPGLTFGSPLRVVDLSELARGTIAYTQGTVTGQGRIDWTGADITSSGTFRTDDLDLAAAFGPVDGIRGEVRFTDLINLTTAPGQVIEIASINPGIEALSGKLRFSLTDGTTIRIEDARWPFMGGELIMRPTILEYGTDKDQNYIFEIIALDAATFVAQMELANLGASGTFDGTLPIIFDAEGNGRIEGGLLISRATGGNVSYIGELTYEDMGAISNYAFQSLRSLDYRQMSVELNGDLAGEIITRFRIDGVRQGADASRNFITRRLARLPIRFNINVRAENFYELATMVRTFWDPDALSDRVDQVINAPGALRDRALMAAPEPRADEPVPEPPAQTPPETPVNAPRPPQPGARDIDAARPDELIVQPPESETMP